MEKRNFKEDTINYIDDARNKYNCNVMLVEADSGRGFNYSYLIYVPENPSSTLVMDCLNDYEAPLSLGETENLSAIEEVYSAFGDKRVSGAMMHTDGKTEENRDKSLDRLYYRIAKGFDALSNLIGKNFNAPAIVPLIPGYGNEGFSNVASQLDRDRVGEIAPQIEAIIKDAKMIVEKTKSGIRLNDEIICYGHSKSSTFANNFSTINPQMAKVVVLGGTETITLPIDEIALEVVSDEEISDNEKFKKVDGKIVKRVTKTEFEEIVAEYNRDKKPSWQDISRNEDGTYNLPMNFPLGIANIEEYVDLTKFEGGKEEYRALLTNVPRMLFVGEHEEHVSGHFAYNDAQGLSGAFIRAGEDMDKKEINPIEVERAGMHNRILEYYDALRILFGKSANERLRNYMELCELLEIPIQSKIYEGVGHVDINKSEELANDVRNFYKGIESGIIPNLDDVGRVSNMSPIHQLVRRYMVSKTQEEYDRKDAYMRSVSKKELSKKIEKRLSETGKANLHNMDRVYDGISVEELEEIFEERNIGEKTVFLSRDIQKIATSRGVTGKEDAKRHVKKDMEAVQEKDDKKIK